MLYLLLFIFCFYHNACANTEVKTEVKTEAEYSSSKFPALNATELLKSQENVTVILINQGYDPALIPENLEAFSPVMLQDSSIIYKADSQRDITTISSSKYTDVFLGEYKNFKPVAVKISKLTELLFQFESSMIMTYVQDTVPTPYHHGYVRIKKRLGMVHDFVPNSQTLQKLLISTNITDTNLVSIAMQVTEALVKIHQKFVLHNDYHTSNILVTMENNKSVVKVIDFGQATFRIGTPYVPDFGNIYTFVAPEFSDDSVLSSPATEVYSLGEVLRRINIRLKKRVLNRIVTMCMQTEREKRPSAKGVAFLLSLFLNNLKTADSLSVVKGKERKVPVDFEDLPFMNKTIPLITSADAVSSKTDRFVWIKKSDTTNIFLATYLDRSVAVKVYKQTDYKYLLNEALIYMYMNDTSVTPYFYGLYPTGQLVSSLGLVNRFFASAEVVEDLVPGMKSRTVRFQLSVIVRICQVVQTFHDRGLLINNIGLDNFLVQADKDFADIKIVGLSCVSGLEGLTDSIILQDIIAYNSTSPEVEQSGTTSVQSDVYSVGRALLELNGHDLLAIEIARTFEPCLMKGLVHCPKLTHIIEVFENISKSDGSGP
ncbi:uncharacterized protein LOC126830194 [Patella vulgata]|uniref:uncharacterized protein LOC126830194 n=1 Tax=Patella vulgata TaxID=6465 RepID=UPI0024A91EBC|nr:uncharacterized protein LOC126830194 [Patella vulgata]